MCDRCVCNSLSGRRRLPRLLAATLLLLHSVSRADVVCVDTTMADSVPSASALLLRGVLEASGSQHVFVPAEDSPACTSACLLYTSDAADE